ncbi:ATP synthase subunit I [Geochorda subterranea]|uniref:ATP synthase subunit I n=1 Tax=Geochorda subterranea TaxID=3109564 RepID=A0ABZ1BQB9_9FIRM|nr:ATP synthase subunit I [Limnochorda sp. LNt]WRP14828.1 ATP synthase subunit I [Limnochorda sp. LNt]
MPTPAERRDEASGPPSPRRWPGLGTWQLALTGGALAALAWWIGYPDAAWGVAAGTPAGMVNHGLTRRALERWQAGGSGSGWVLGASMLRLAVAATLLWWAAGRGLPFLLGMLAGLMVEVIGYVLTAPRYIRHSKADGR